MSLQQKSWYQGQTSVCSAQQQQQYLWSCKELPQLRCWSPDRGSKTSAPHLWQFRRLMVRRGQSFPSGFQRCREEKQPFPLPNKEDEFPVKADGASVPTCTLQGCWAVGPDPQQHDRWSSVTLSSLQRLKELQGEGPVQASPQRRAYSLREAEVGWVSNTLFGTTCLGYCVDTSIRGLELLTNFGVPPSC
ncbi:hypothetical protein AB205_0043020 [Aquarana catesbeiana]|uniref:Uncharacterized protein n=1 Tax=Aquarana catesbeiana TaxID=8400 RepID=A0A2G9R5Y7_AQUCT|nr:hypothetical protein AB205_0043020 [Aquarana catesbeiana]